MAFLKLNPSTAFAGCGEKENSSTLKFILLVETHQNHLHVRNYSQSSAVKILDRRHLSDENPHLGVLRHRTNCHARVLGIPRVVEIKLY